MNLRRHGILLLLSAALLLCGCASSPGSPNGEGYHGPTLPARTIDDDTWDKGPAKPRQQTPYPYDIYAHCGVKWVEFGGRWWVLDTVFPGVAQVEGDPPPPNAQRLSGYMTLIGPDTANFDAAGLPTMQFTPAREKPPGCA
ncbi:hypothetical protein [Streptomyces fructofermentans]|uniref:hypothetical protein n=1 Tax=Streptomyces fructofermentans TaxID=152141 RepID=UPI0037B90DE1